MIVHKKSCYTTKTHPSAALRLSWSRREWHSKQKQLLHSKSDIDEDDQMTRNMHNNRENYPCRTSSKDNKSFEEGWSNIIIICSPASATSDPETPVLHPFDATAQLPINLKAWTTSLPVVIETSKDQSKSGCLCHSNLLLAAGCIVDNQGSLLPNS